MKHYKLKIGDKYFGCKELEMYSINRKEIGATLAAGVSWRYFNANIINTKILKSPIITTIFGS